MHWQVYKKECGWEVIYIALVEFIKYLLEIMWEYESPATLYVCSKPYDEIYINGTSYNDDISERCEGSVLEAPWLRYAEWLITCPVILIALSNLSGLKDDYNFRTMKLLSSDQGTIVMGVTAAYSTGGVKGAFFTAGVCYGMTTFYTAFLVYAEAYENVPAGKCKQLVSQMAYMFYVSWLMFPTLFLLGPEGAGHLTNYGSVIAHTFADLLSKNLWGFWSLFLRQAVRNHHRKLYKEEMERERLGLAELSIPKEARPDINEAMNSLLLHQFGNDAIAAKRQAAAATIEETVDPFYAEYRRKRRQRRGSLSGAVDEDGPAAPPPASMGTMASGGHMDFLRAPGSAAGSLGSQQARMMNLAPQMHNASALFSSGASNGHLMNGGGIEASSSSSNGQSLVIVLDARNSEFGAFYGEKLETEFGLRVILAANVADLQSNMLAHGGAVAGVFFAETTMDPETVASMRATWRKPFIAYGVRNLQASGLPADDYLKVPQIGVPYDQNMLSMIVAKHLSFSGAGGSAPAPASPFGATAPSRWQSAAAANGAPAPNPGKANIDRLLADIAKLKTTLNSQQGGGSP